MRPVVCVLLLMIAAISTTPGRAQPYHASVVRLAVQDTPPFDALIAYPTRADEAPVEDGPFTLVASRDAPIASGARYPVVLFSHGSGRGPGTPLVHRDLLLHLARAGFT